MIIFLFFFKQEKIIEIIGFYEGFLETTSSGNTSVVMNAGKFISQLDADGPLAIYIWRASFHVVLLWSLRLTR